MNFTQITSRIYFLTKTNSSSFPIADLTAAANVAVEDVAGRILKADSRWQWDDTNQTDLPNATTALVSGQQDYSITTTHLSIDRVEIKDSAGNWTLLQPIDPQEIRGISLSQYAGANGMPVTYDKVANSVILYPTPNYSLSAALKLYFTRGPVAFETSDTTKQPGFNSLFHDLVPLKVAYDYAVANGLPTAQGFMSNILKREKDLEDFYGSRDRDHKRRFSVSTSSSGSTSGRFNSGGNDSTE